MRHARRVTVTRDVALILLAGALVLAALTAATVLAAMGRVPSAAVLAPATAAIGVASFALGRLGPPTDPTPLPDPEETP